MQLLRRTSSVHSNFRVMYFIGAKRKTKDTKIIQHSLKILYAEKVTQKSYKIAERHNCMQWSLRVHAIVKSSFTRIHITYQTTLVVVILRIFYLIISFSTMPS